MTTAVMYGEFAAREAHGVSPAYERQSYAVSRDGEILALLAALPPMKRQPNLLFGVVRLLGGPVEDPTAFRAYAVANWPAIEAEMRIRATQTNEAGRCAVLLAVLAGCRSRSRCWRSARPRDYASTPTGTATVMATAWSAQAFRSSTARRSDNTADGGSRCGVAGRPGSEPA
jgi:hypothetical protein